MDLTIVVPFFNGHQWIDKLTSTLPSHLPIIVVDDLSEAPYHTSDPRITVIRPEEKGYFAGACNVGWNACETDVLILNQDVWFEGDGWLNELAELSREYDCIGDGVMAHPAWPQGYVQGTFMYASRRAIEATGDMNARDYPLWGCTAEGTRQSL